MREVCVALLYVLKMTTALGIQDSRPLLIKITHGLLEENDPIRSILAVSLGEKRAVYKLL